MNDNNNTFTTTSKNNFSCHLLGIYLKYFAKHFTYIISLQKEGDTNFPI